MGKPGDEHDFGPCVLDEARFVDPETKEWGYAVICTNSTHKGPEPCPEEREMFRLPHA